MQEIPTWVCIAQHESSFNTAAVGRLNTDGSADHGLFQISDLYWCSHDLAGGKACHISCDKLLDSDISDDVQCIKTIYEEHTRLSGDGFTAWTVYNGHCRQKSKSEIAECFNKDIFAKEEERPSSSNSLTRTPQAASHAKPKGKIYKRCELAQELYFKHKIPMQEIPTWVCIAQHESSFNTAAVGRLNTDGSADHGLFQISDLYWCSHDLGGGKACHISCDKLLDSDISDDVQCVKTIYEEHTRISGDGFTAWTVYNGHCRKRSKSEIADCFDKNVLAKEEVRPSSSNSVIRSPQAVGHSKPKGKVYKRCELAQELYFKHKMPMQEIPTWVCIAQHESSYNTAAVGRLNTDGSADHGLFQISDLYWCSHDLGGGKACHISCDKLLDSDISDDIQCVRTIYEEHTRLSGDGFTAWTVYNGHCRHQSLAQLSDCFSGNEIKESQPIHYAEKPQTTTQKPQLKIQHPVKIAANHPYADNPFLQPLIKLDAIYSHVSNNNEAINSFTINNETNNSITNNNETSSSPNNNNSETNYSPKNNNEANNSIANNNETNNSLPRNNETNNSFANSTLYFSNEINNSFAGYNSTTADSRLVFNNTQEDYSKSTVQYKLPSTTPRPRPSTTPKPYLFDAKTKTTTTTRKSTTTTRSPTNIRNSTASPFDHPFFDKFRAQFDENIASSTNSRKPVITSPYYDKFKQNNALSGSKTVYSYGFGQNGPKTTTIKRPSTQSPTTTRKPASGFDIYLNWNKG
ncbi:uncharacterized protein LOC115632734 [Scaptodrosophila lebanonensis]|uniref:lysozyme n=1 Tax=Drosophila lebanonensis TaxID=7225 RepID=A0A6J2UCN1_DROLE|nr:uncharacterized protein LOC115632734 [Scaptodrosophila lebanonensis]